MRFLRTEHVAIGNLSHWGRNPRQFTDESVKILAEQFIELGQYKPIIVDESGTILGGNARYEALKMAGMETAWVSVVEATNDSERLFFALSDNDMVGVTDRAKLMEILETVSIDLEKYSVDFGHGKSVEFLLENVLKSPSGLGPMDNDIVKVVFSYPSEQFDEVINGLEAILDKEGLGDQTEATLFLLKQYENA